MLIHELWVGMTCNVNRGWRTSQRCAEMLGDAPADQVEELAELDGAVTLGHIRDDLPRGRVRGGIEVGGARRRGSPAR